jgi:hypothetical protein
VKRLLLICCGLAALLVPAAQAGKGSRSVGISEPAPYVFGETIHPFTNVQSYGDRGPYYSLFCYQGGLTVYGIAQYLVTPRDGSVVAFTLAGQGWTSGAANCDLTVWHVNAGYKNRTQDAALSFLVGA